ncbi:MAG: ABC transporter permease [Pseudomonadota bacterium]
MTRALAIIERDLRKFRRNPVVLAMSVLMPLLYLIILGNSFQGKLHNLPMVVVDHDGGPYSKRLLENLTAIASGPKTISIIMATDEVAALDDTKKGRYMATLVIPERFSKKAAQVSKPEIALFLDNTDTISSESIRSTVSNALRFLGAGRAKVREKKNEFFLRDTNLYPKVDYNQSLVPGVVIMAIFLGALTTGAFTLVMDRFLGIDESYMLTPITKTDIVMGLTISGLSITMTIACFILLVSMAITGIPFGKSISSYISLLAVIFITTFSLLSLIFVILNRVKHPRIVGILTGFLNVILFFPSGAVYPIESFPVWLRAFARINPEAYAINAFKIILFKGASIEEIASDLAFLVGFSVIMMTIAIITFKRSL